MSRGYSLKADNKPTLYSWDLDTEFKNIECRVLDNKNYSQRDLENELAILKKLASDYLKIIQTKTLGSEQLNNLSGAITNGAGGIWEQATTKLEKLAYHFQDAKELIRLMINRNDANTVNRALVMLNDAFTENELIEIIDKLLSHKSKRIRAAAANTALVVNNKKILPILLNKREIEIEKTVIEALNFTITH